MCISLLHLPCVLVIIIVPSIGDVLDEAETPCAYTCVL